jgi:hypothetical protein
MGGKGSGGARVGAGKKRRDPQGSWLSGRGPRPETALAVAVDVPVPSTMAADEAAVWSELAPHATAEGTLTPRTAAAFRTLCRVIVLERRLSEGEKTCAGPDHRGMLQRVETGMARFRLTPDGRPVAVAPVVDEWAEFDQPLSVIRGGKA